MDVRRFDLPVAVTLRLQSRSGKVLVVAEAREDVEAETDAVESYFDQAEATLVIRSSRGGSKPLTVRCPIDTDLNIGTHSGSVRLDGKFGTVRVTTMSGNIDVESAEEADLRSMSGSVSIATCFGRCRMNAMSGKLAGGKVDSLWANTVSGGIRVERVVGEVHAHSVSGSIELFANGDGEIAVKTVSGKVHIGLPDGTEPHTYFKTRGHVRCDFAQGDDCTIKAASLSGSIEVVPG
jgi:DUF4097 and DUF4098 domain-containing protein YvlB